MGKDFAKQYRVRKEPYYRTVANEEVLYEAAYARRMPVMLKGPTGCGKSRFVEYMAWKLDRPLITVACNEDMTASDLVGRFLLDKEGTKWQDGPLTTAARLGAICYLDEVVEARQDTTVVIHPLTDHRRTLPLDKKGELIEAHADFQLVISYNPGYQSLMKDLKQSTKQRFGGLDFSYPEADIETEIVAHEGGVDAEIAGKLVRIAERSRNLKGHGLDEGMSTRLLVYAAQLVGKGIDPMAACQMALVTPLTDDTDTVGALVTSLSTDIMPSRGSYPTAAINKGRALLEQAGAAVGEILLITDGGVSPAAERAARDLRGSGYTLSVLGVGTPEGAPIPRVSGGFVTDQSGTIAVPRLEERPLRDLALAGGGRFAMLSTDDRDIERLLSGEAGSRSAGDDSLATDQWREEGPWLLLLLLPLAAMAFRRGWVMLLALAVLPVSQPAEASLWDDLWLTKDQQAQRALENGSADDAAALFDNTEWRGVARYRAGDYRHQGNDSHTGERRATGDQPECSGNLHRRYRAEPDRHRGQ